MNNPLVSIIVASYNYEQFIAENLNSILNQTYKFFEVIVVDDGSTDNSVNIIKEFVEKDNRFKLIQHENQENKGLSKSVEYALSFVRGEWVAFCESDDYWDENYLSEKINYINNNPTADIVINKPLIIGPDEARNKFNKIFGLLYQRLKNLKKPTNLYFEICSVTFPTFSVVMIKKELLEEKNYNPPIRNGLDVWLWRQVALTGLVGYVDKYLTYYRRHDFSNIAKGNNATLEMYHEYENGLDKFAYELCHKSIQSNIKFKVMKIKFDFKRLFYFKKIKKDYIITRILFFKIKKKYVDNMIVV